MNSIVIKVKGRNVPLDRRANRTSSAGPTTRKNDAERSIAKRSVGLFLARARVQLGSALGRGVECRPVPLVDCGLCGRSFSYCQCFDY